MDPVSFSVNTLFLIRVGEATGDLSGLSSIRIYEPGLTSKCPVSDNTEEFTIDNELFSVDSLEEFCRAREVDSKNSIETLSDERQIKVSDLLTEAINELDLIDTEEEAEQYIKDFMKDDSSNEIEEVISATDIDEDDLFASIFTYSGWEIGEIFVSSDPDLSHEVEVVFIFDCNLHEDEIIENISGLCGEEVSEESRTSITKILDSLKSRYGLKS